MIYFFIDNSIEDDRRMTLRRAKGKFGPTDTALPNAAFHSMFVPIVVRVVSTNDGNVQRTKH